MSRASKTLRAVQWALLASILLYVVVGEMIAPRATRIDQTLSYILSSLAVGIVGTIFVVRRTLVLPATASLSSSSEEELTLSQWKTGHIATYALCDALAIFGLLLRLRGSSLQQSLLFYVGGFVLLMFFRPNVPAEPTAT
ncbi:MAG TPA: hypothetical protein VKV39_00670 [Candidatus Sulfotelmatobacter sp.]|nr:hypothetical protein [Candidatus Sulfotelmatobacter sp.]